MDVETFGVEILIVAVIIIEGEGGGGGESKRGEEEGAGEFFGDAERAFGEPGVNEGGVRRTRALHLGRREDLDGVRAGGAGEGELEGGLDEVGASGFDFGEVSFAGVGAEDVAGLADDAVAGFVVPSGGEESE
jgi:hypothetical protein